MMEWKRFEWEGDSLRDSFAARTSKSFKAGDRRRLQKSGGDEVLAFRSERAIVIQVCVLYYQGLDEGLGDAIN